MIILTTLTILNSILLLCIISILIIFKEWVIEDFNLLFKRSDENRKIILLNIWKNKKKNLTNKK